MEKRKFTGLIFVLLFLPVLFISCPSADEEDEAYKPAPIGTYSGTASTSAGGFGTSQAYFSEHGVIGQPITVTVTMLNGFITTVIIDGPSETPDFGGVLVRTLGPKVVQYNTFALDDVGVDGLSGASKTFGGIKEAGNAAIEQIKALPQ